jgi:hypothetical protein
MEIPKCEPSPQQPAECRRIGTRGDHQHIAYTGEHQRRQRVVDHWLVEDGQQLLARVDRDRKAETRCLSMRDA